MPTNFNDFFKILTIYESKLISEYDVEDLETDTEVFREQILNPGYDLISYIKRVPINLKKMLKDEKGQDYIQVKFFKYCDIVTGCKFILIGDKNPEKILTMELVIDDEKFNLTENNVINILDKGYNNIDNIFVRFTFKIIKPVILTLVYKGFTAERHIRRTLSTFMKNNKL